MIKDRKVFQSVLLEYSGKPTIKVTVDGSHVLTASGKTLPNHLVRKTRRVSLPAGSHGYVPQMSADLTDVTRHQFEGVSEAQYRENTLFHYYEITFLKGLQIKMFIDEVAVKPNNGIEKVVS